MEHKTKPFMIYQALNVTCWKF